MAVASHQYRAGLMTRVDQPARGRHSLEALAVLLAGLTNSRLSFDGAHHRYDDVPMELHPLQRPYPPLWYPTNNPESVEYAAANGYNFVGLVRRGVARAGRRVLAELGAAPARPWQAQRPRGAPKVGILRQVVVADTDEEASATARAADGDRHRSITKLWHDHNDHSVDGLFTWETATQYETMIFGSPARVREQVARLLAESGCNYLICAFAWGTLPHQQHCAHCGCSRRG